MDKRHVLTVEQFKQLLNDALLNNEAEILIEDKKGKKYKIKDILCPNANEILIIKGEEKWM